jgi:hypothetical protein
VTRYIVSYVSSGKLLVEAESEDEAKAAVAAAVRERNLRPKLSLSAESLDDLDTLPGTTG